MASLARTIVEALEQRSSSRDSGFTHLAMDGSTRFESFHELHACASRIGLALQQRGCCKGDRVALILSDTQEFIDSVFGAFLVGAVPVPLAPPSGRLADGAAYLRHLRAALTHAHPPLVLAD